MYSGGSNSRSETDYRPFGLLIRPVSLHDAAAIADIYQPIVEKTTISFEQQPPSCLDFRRRIVATVSAYPWLVCEINDQVIGYTYGHAFRERAAYRHSVEVSIYLAEVARGRGLGSALYKALLDQLSEAGHHRAFAGIALPNEASLALHRRLGFEPVGTFREAGYKHGRWIDVHFVQRAL